MESNNSTTQKGKSFLFGGITGTISQFVTFPLDYYKINRQLVKSNNLPFNKQLIHGFKVSIPQSIITFPRVGIRFYSFEQYNKYLDNKLLAGIGAGMTETLVIYNISETIKTNSIKQVMTYTQSIKYIYNNRGIFGFYNGLPWSILRQSTSQGLSFYFHGVYSDILKNYENEYFQSGSTNIVAGSLAGMTAVVINNPIDVIKTRRQSSNTPILSIIKSTYNEGLSTFYRGCFPRMTRLGVQQGINFYLFSELKKWWDKNM